MSRYGQFHVAEPLGNMSLFHRHTGTPLHTANHQPPLAVLEQENFGAQEIDTSALIPGAPKVDALGNCVYNAGTAAVSCLGAVTYDRYLTALGLSALGVSNFSDTKLAEEAAIIAYHRGTDLTGNTAQEWPPTDCGSSGVYLVQLLQSLGIVTSQRIAHGAQDIASLLQTSPVLLGGPFFNSWEEPDKCGFIDGNGSHADLQSAMRSGLAGGHERLSFAIESISLTGTGQVIPEKTVLVDRNSWSKSWGDAGNYRVHLSTYVMLGAYMDFRALVA